tara:strand:- start:4834 stop:5667 length:834 start_codon:yes stop_codon:yes gene_type:complete
MAILKISDEFQDELITLLKSSQSLEETIDILKKDSKFSNLLISIENILKEDKFVQFRGGKLSNYKFFFAGLVSCFGEYYGVIEHTGIKVDCDYTGCSRNQLFLHNDDAIDIERQPRLGFIQLIKKDPILKVKNGVVLIRELIRELKFKNPNLLNELLTVPVPMCSYGINYDGDSKRRIVIKEPILSKDDSGYKVRFDFERISFYYKDLNKRQPYVEGKMIFDFLQYANSIKKILYLDVGDILIQKNKETLHDRDECSIEIGVDGQLNTREILVSFAR